MPSTVLRGLFEFRKKCLSTLTPFLNLKVQNFNTILAAYFHKNMAFVFIHTSIHTIQHHFKRVKSSSAGTCIRELLLQRTTTGWFQRIKSQNMKQPVGEMYRNLLSFMYQPTQLENFSYYGGNSSHVSAYKTQAQEFKMHGCENLETLLFSSSNHLWQPVFPYKYMKQVLNLIYLVFYTKLSGTKALKLVCQV